MQTGSEERVAVVAVHGIADQLPGQTVRELARLLCHGSAGEPRFVQGELREVLVPVARLEAGAAATPAGQEVPSPRQAEPEPTLARKKPGSPSGFYQQHINQPEQHGGLEDDTPPRDLGLELNDYLLGRLSLSESDALYQTTRISLRRRRDHLQVDLFELYWADLSRLGNGGIASLVSLYHLFLSLCTLAADVVDQVAMSQQGGRRWRLLQRLHAWEAWLMKAPVVLVQLAMLLLLLFGIAALVPVEQQGRVLVALYVIAALVLTALGLLSWLHTAAPMARRVKASAWVAAALGCAALAIFIVWNGGAFGYLYLGTGVLLTAAAGVWAVERYARAARGVRICGHVVVGATMVMLLAESWRVYPFVTSMYEWLLSAALGTGEVLVAVILLVWAAFVLVQMGALLLGLWLARQAIDTRVKASLHTARVGLILSTGLFTVLSLVLWSVLAYVAGHSLDEVRYESRIFDAGFWPSGTAFLDARLRSLGGFFTPLVVLSTSLGVAGLLVLAPALLEELAPTVNLDEKGTRPGAQRRADRLGRWLGDGTGMLDKVLTLVMPFGAIAGGVLYLAFVIQQFGFALGFGGALADTMAGWLENFRGEALVTTGKWMAGGALTIAALGSRFTNTFGRLRVVIDAIMDVDNYFGDPPDGQSPRARIFSRYASMLAYLRASGYTRIVLVSHSQGTVISAELLHYLHVQGRLRELVGDTPVALVTVGSPLRDLYAARFPLLYGWMGSPATEFDTAGPSAADIGVCEWVNACRAGDYVGRFIWTPADEPERYRIAPLDPDEQVVARRAGDRTEFCLGTGAHTRYFSNDALALGRELERLIVGEAWRERRTADSPETTDGRQCMAVAAVPSVDSM